MPSVRSVSLILAALGLAGCTVGPDYTKPTTTMPSSWAPPTTSPTTLPSTTDTRPMDLINWWKAFNDPVLDSLVQRATDQNLSVQQAEARIRQARAQLGISESAQWPDVNANAAYTRTRRPGLDNNGVQSDLYRAGFDAAWELDVFGGTRRAIEAADADIVAAVEDRRDVLVTLFGDVANTYIDLRSQQQRIIIAQANLDLQQRTADVTHRQHTAGFVTSLDVANADTQVANTRSSIPLLESQLRQDIYTLSLLLGQEPATLLNELTPVGLVPLTPPQIPVGLPSDLLRRRADIRRSEAQIHAATARIGVATADLFPKFSLTGSLGISADKLSGLSNIENHNWSIGPNMSWDIFNAGRVQSSIQVQQALRDQVTLTYRQTVLVALRDVDSSLTAYEKEQERRQALADAVASSRIAVNQSQLLYSAGQVDFLNVLTAQRSLLASEDAYAQSTQIVATNLVSLYKALGGGWESNAYPATRPVAK